MEFRIADTFTGSLARLTGEEQKAVKTTAFDLQMDVASPGLQFHRLDKSKDKNFWSVRVSGDLRLIVHRNDQSLLLCYVGHHDKAYEWAERRRLDTHPRTGAAQFVEVRERVREVVVPVAVTAPVSSTPKPLLFATLPDDELLGYGVPSEWLADVRLADEDSLLALCERLPAEASEALLELATGGKPRVPVVAAAEANPFEHPDALRRFRVMSNVEELEQALEFPWDKWTVFLHPEQRAIVEREQNGPARVSGSAGTGKTIVALHRAVHLARSNPDARVLLTTYSSVLANALRSQLMRLIGTQPRLAERLEVHAINDIAQRLYTALGGQDELATHAQVRELLRGASTKIADHKFSDAFLLTEWEQVVDAWQLTTWEGYRDVARLGRRTRLPEPRRAVLWSIFEQVHDGLSAKKLITRSGMLTKLEGLVAKAKHPPFDLVVVDEAQDMGVGHLRLFAGFSTHRPDALFFAGDLGQRIFQQPFSWLALGVDIRGRSRTLKVNYRTSHQIRMQADRLLEPRVSDADGNTEDRGHTISVFNGPAPDIRVLDEQQAEQDTVAAWIKARAAEGVSAHEFGVFVRSSGELDRARAAVSASGLAFKVLDDNVETASGYVAISTMHLAKGLEFRAVVVMACDDEVIPSQQRIETVADDADLEDVYNTERHLLYVACTRARDHLLVTGVAPASEFLSDMMT